MSAQYLLPCSCGQKIRVAAAQAGGEVPCACGKRLAVPTLRGIRQLEPAVDAPVKTLPTWTRVHGGFFAGGLVLFCIGLGILAYCSFRYAQLASYTVDRSADVIKQYAGQLDKITPTEALDIWQKEILEEGLGEPHEPLWVAAKARRGEYSTWMKWGGGMLGLGALMVAAALLVGRR